MMGTEEAADSPNPQRARFDQSDRERFVRNRTAAHPLVFAYHVRFRFVLNRLLLVLAGAWHVG